MTSYESSHETIAAKFGDHPSLRHLIEQRRAQGWSREQIQNDPVIQSEAKGCFGLLGLLSLGALLAGFIASVCEIWDHFHKSESAAWEK